ncbi:hypothetical protein ACMT1E_11520 [Sphingomonas flavalba]|uniref:hypothetical protein n=1 Tax=Sphingomonas flavalba TaxID=2559804 RepID=UPI0039E08D2A
MIGGGFAAVLSVVMLVAAALIIGGVYLLRTGQDRKRGWLMLVAALVLFGNVLVWSV